MKGLWQFLGLALALTGCASNTHRTTYSPGDVRTVEFFVADTSGKTLEGVDVILVGAEERLLGKTDYLGRISVDESVLRSSGAHAVLFCSDWFFCGAIRIDKELNGYTEQYIVLATFAMR